MDNETWSEFDSCRKRLIQALAASWPQLGPRDFDAELQAVWRASFVWAETHEKARRVTFEEVAECDTRAMGHVDWATKLPLYVAEKMYSSVNNYQGRGPGR